MNHNAEKCVPEIRVTQIGEDALLFFFNPADMPRVAALTQQKLWHLARWLEPQRDSLGLIEIVPGMGNLLLRARRITLLNTLRDLVLSHWPQLPTSEIEGRLIEIPVSYGGDWGPDLEAVAQHCELSPQQVVELHSRVTYRVYCLGFQPGFAYLGELDSALEVPRLDTPRLSVPSGSIAICGAQSAIYPSASPGGWRLIGRTEICMFDPHSEQASLLCPGDSVRFIPLGDPQ